MHSRSNKSFSAIIFTFFLIIAAVLLPLGVKFAKTPAEIESSQSIVESEDFDSNSSVPSVSNSEENEESIIEESTFETSEPYGDNTNNKDLLVVFGSSIPPVPSSQLPKITSPFCFMYDVTHDAVLFSKNEFDKAYPASVTKLLTAAVASDYCEPDTAFTVGDELDLVKPHSSLAYLEKGQVLTFEALMDALMLPSGNDAAYVMACGVGRIVTGNKNADKEDAVDCFINLMNKKAKAFGCTGSNFVTPDGFYDDNHYTTASDMTKIAVSAMKIEIISQSCAKRVARHQFLSGEDKTWYNNNRFLTEYKYATGLKTGYVGAESGYCIAASAEKDGTVLVAVIFKSQTSSLRNDEAANLFKAGFAHVDRYFK